MTENELGDAILGCAIRVHKAPGPGLLESAYEACLAHEFEKTGLTYSRQPVLPVIYDGLRIDAGYRIDLLVADLVVVEVKAVEKLLDVHPRLYSQLQCDLDEGRHKPAGEWTMT